jgi:hypothetical protein
MSTGETHRNLDDLVSAAVAECGKLGTAIIVPWQIEAREDRLHNGLEQCGCAFSPGEPEDDGRPLP